MKISPDQFRTSISQAFLAGYNGQDKEAFIQATLGELGFAKEADAEEFRIYTLEELRALPDDSYMTSENLGAFRVVTEDNHKMAIFASDKILSHASFSINGYPWDCRVRRTTKEEYDYAVKLNNNPS